MTSTNSIPEHRLAQAEDREGPGEAPAETAQRNGGNPAEQGRVELGGRLALSRVHVLAIAAAALTILALGWLGWLWSHRLAVRGHWDAVARGRAYLEQGRPDRALQAVLDVRDEAPGAGEAMTLAGLALIRFGEYRGARLALERGLRLQPDQFGEAVTLAELNFALGNGRRGIEVLQMAARLRPREFRVWLTMGKVFHDLGDLSRAIQAYEKALELKPRDREALLGLIGALIQSDQPDEAERWVAKAVQQFPDDPVVLGFAARREFDANRLDEAIDLAGRALAHDPQNAHALLARARSYVVRAQWQRALVDAEAAVAVVPNDLGALQLLLKIETRMGLKSRAAATQAGRKRVQERIASMNQLNNEIAQHPDDPRLCWRMGQTALEAGSYLLASRCFEAALGLDPSFQPARTSLAALRASHPELVPNSGRPSSRFPGAGISVPSSLTDP